MIQMPDPILLATDGSEDALAAAHAAADLARHTGAHLHVVHVWQPARVGLPGEAGEPLGEEAAQAVLDTTLDEVRRGGAAAAAGHLRSGRAVDEILRTADEVDAGLVVLGSRGLGTVHRAFVGSVSEGVVHHSTRPVLVLRAGHHAWPPARVVIGDDASVDARRAGDLGATIGHMFGTTAVVVRALSKLPRLLEGEVDADARTVDDALRVAESSLAQRAQELEPVLGQRPRVHVAIDDPASALISLASDDDEPAMIAVGTRGLGPVQRWRFGSVSTDVLRGAPGAVLINAHPH
jgi:nucleotide-binding universal stress UspA family protein